MAGGEEEELLALRVLLLDLVAIFAEILYRGLYRWPPNHFEGKWTTMDDESTLNLTVSLHGITQHVALSYPRLLTTTSQLSTLNIDLGKMGDHATIATKQVLTVRTTNTTSEARYR